MFHGTESIKRNWLGILAIVAVGIAQSGYAAGSKTDRAYLCETKTHGPGGWTPSEIVFRFTGDHSKVVVLDGLIKHVRGAPITAAVKSRTGGKKRFRWSLAAPTAAGHKINVSYRVDFDPATLSGKIITKHTGFASEPLGGVLTCKPYKGNLV